jgi:hypothetical protein
MANANSPGRQLLNAVIAEAVTPLTRAVGFRKSGLNFHRRRGEVVQVLGFRVDPASTSDKKDFSADVGLAICKLAGVAILENVKEYQCDDRGTRGPLCEFISRAPGSWIVRASQPADKVRDSLSRNVTAVIEEMNEIEDVESFSRHRWFSRVEPAPVRASVFYLLGDLESALREVKALAEKFHDRINACRARWWVDQLELAKLVPLLREKAE